LAVLIALAWGLVTARLQFVYAPWLLFPLCGGLILGGVLVIVGRGIGFPGTRRGAIVVALLACSVAVPAQHVFCYRHDVADRLRHPDIETERLARAAMPELTRDTFWQYLDSEATLGRPMPFGMVARGTAAWASHALDAALVVVGAVLIAAQRTLRPAASDTPESKPSNEQTTV
jgi:hypothetical protein